MGWVKLIPGKKKDRGYARRISLKKKINEGLRIFVYEGNSLWSDEIWQLPIWGLNLRKQFLVTSGIF
jgi:hypothetical protein